jgi:hypothetical protein
MKKIIRDYSFDTIKLQELNLIEQEQKRSFIYFHLKKIIPVIENGEV